MNKRTTKRLIVASGLALGLIVAIGSPLQARAAEPMAGMTMTADGMKEQCKQMHERKRQMREDMKAQDARLTDQLGEMNRAPDDKKLGLLAALVTNTVEQRIAMDARKADMEDAMMKHMMQHMKMGAESMSHCPMMKGMEAKTAAAPMKNHEKMK
jgi:hypothetical protein